MQVVFLIVDALPNAMVGPTLMPTLTTLIDEGGWHPAGGVASLASSTYPNHATFATGADPVDHRVIVNRVRDGDRWVPAARSGPAVPTIFNAASAAGLSTSIVAGDAKIVGSMGGLAADTHWPPGGRAAEGVATDAFGYAADSAVLDAIDDLDALQADLAVVHLNEPDTALHRFGPASDEVRDQVQISDTSIAAVAERIRPRWADTVVCIVSDHDQEAVDPDRPVDIAASFVAGGLPGIVETDGTAALIVDGPPLDRLCEIDGVGGAIAIDASNSLAWSEPGRAFGADGYGLLGGHGSPRTRTQLASVTGGHPMVARLARALAERQPAAADWAPTVLDLFGVEMPQATGRTLLRPDR